MILCAWIDRDVCTQFLATVSESALGSSRSQISSQPAASAVACHTGLLCSGDPLGRRVMVQNASAAVGNLWRFHLPEKAQSTRSCACVRGAPQLCVNRLSSWPSLHSETIF